ncbi:hypothetical protein J9317_15165 [Metabacillus sp. KIGAM252]|uniref:Preprotein translocase subunit SecA n=1 Tax=Metabacillus flavus TaxID=2823519 RepID=A0ABS5LH94_9BACI|nr:hypothetical protein [Metabacillus flavus]MBS2970110.1 hypothetical protein [Metabacillus flavus]
MTTVHFFDGKNIVLSQMLKRVPSVGEDLKIKGKLGKVSEVTQTDEKNVRVLVAFQSVSKIKAAADNSKKKKR